MANLTISVDDELLREARVRAVQDGTSVNRLLREHLERYVRGPLGSSQATDEILKLAQDAKARRGGRRFSRDDLHERG
jgi:plasmid stability protein